MAKYFTIKELTHSSMAVSAGIDNTPSPQAKAGMLALIDNCLDPVRELWGRPVYVNSGFRCPTLNKASGGAENSQHTKGEAADITTGSPQGNRELFGLIAGSGIPFDQLIDEDNYSWIHISYKTAGNRKQILHL